MKKQIKDLRDWLEIVQNIGELEIVEGADWNLEIGALCEMWGSDAQALLFDKIKGFRPGYRILTNALNSSHRIAAAFGLDPGLGKLDLVKALREKFKSVKLIPPTVMPDGPVLENVKIGDDVDLMQFPTPLWHEMDGGRYIGTGCLTINQDPDSGWINFGAYRAMIHDRNATGMCIVSGHHGLLIMEKYWRQGKPCPMAVSVGQEPLLTALSGIEVPYGESEYDWAGGLHGYPIEVIKGPVTGLLLPATAELVLEGEVYPQDLRTEGPHGEWTGYYVSGEKQRPVFRVKGICYRRDPIICGAMPGKLPSDNTYFLSPVKSAFIWEQIEKAGIPQVCGVWEHECGGGRMFLVVAIQTLYAGHSKQAGMVAAHCHQGAYANRVTVVVDEDVAPDNLEEVIWAICTRADFRHGVDIIHQGWTSPLDPTHYPSGSGSTVYNSRMIIDATRRQEDKQSFPPVACASPSLQKKIKKKWAALFANRKKVTG